jgi:hypothetical protein
LLQITELQKVSFWTLTDFIFNPAVIFVTLGRGLFNLSFVFVSVPLLYFFATQIYPSLRPPDLGDSKIFYYA